VPIAAVALQFALSHPSVASVVLGASTLNQQASNVDAATTAIPHQLWDALRENGYLRPDAPTPPARRTETSRRA
jgi:D-threo-aldose 1-dehydrogenase